MTAIEFALMSFELRHFTPPTSAPALFRKASIFVIRHSSFVISS